jgi:hypothetical protein
MIGRAPPVIQSAVFAPAYLLNGRSAGRVSKAGRRGSYRIAGFRVHANHVSRRGAEKNRESAAAGLCVLFVPLCASA